MLTHGGATKDLPTLEDERFQSGATQVGGGRQAVVTPAHNDRVVFSRHGAEYICACSADAPLDNGPRSVQIASQGLGAQNTQGGVNIGNHDQ
jgi:hypothetical protein